MISIILVFPLQCRIRVYCLVYVTHTLKSGYWFLCIVYVLYISLLLIYPIVLHMNCVTLSFYISLEFALVLTILSVSC